MLQIQWAEKIYKTLKSLNIRQVAYVPDAGHSYLIDRFNEDPDITSVSLTTEEEGVAMLSGSWLAGDRGVLLMQSSGVGNCINMLSLPQESRLPFFTIITMRGEWGEFNSWQVPMGKTVQKTLEASGVLVYRADRSTIIAETVEAAGKMAYQTCRPVAVLIGQRVIGAKNF